MADDSVVVVGDKAINLARILYAQRNAQTGAVVVYFGVHTEESLAVEGEQAAAFWDFYTRRGTTLPGPSGWGQEPIPPHG